MGFYPQSILDEIRDRISISSYIGEHIALKKAGRNFKGNCPFHSEKTPSFMVSDEKEIYHCFGCGEGGNIFSFVMKYEGFSFKEAVEHLAARAAVELPKKEYNQVEKNSEELAAKKKKLLFKINKFVAQFFRDQLTNGVSAERARKYLKLRDISDEISTQHFLGYADDSWDALYMHLKKNNVPLNLAEELGLIKKSPNSSGGYFDFLRDRLIFPIISHRSEILGFGGRIIAEGEKGDTAKYLNSPDSDIYHKSHSVYGLNIALSHIRKNDQVVIVEGYMDVIALNQAGIFNVVAPLGTALTTSHIRLLARHSKNMVLVFDGDAAGIAAAARSLPSFMEVGLMPKVVVLPDGMDPDDWIKKHSKEDFEAEIAGSNMLFSWLIKEKVAECGYDEAKKLGLLKKMEPYFGQLKDTMDFVHYRRVLANEFKMDEGDLVRVLKFQNKGGAAGDNVGRLRGNLYTEKLLVSLMLDHPDFIYKVSQSVSSADFGDGSFRTIFELLIEEQKKGSVTVGRLLDMVADDELKASIHLLSASEEIDDENAVNLVDDCIKYLVRSRLEERLKNITEEIKSAEKMKDENRIFELMSEKNKLVSENL